MVREAECRCWARRGNRSVKTFPWPQERASEERLGVCKPEETSPSNANQVQGAGSQSRPDPLRGEGASARSTETLALQGTGLGNKSSGRREKNETGVQGWVSTPWTAGPLSGDPPTSASPPGQRQIGTHSDEAGTGLPSVPCPPPPPVPASGLCEAVAANPAGWGSLPRLWPEGGW